MPTATVTGALLGWAIEKRINKFRKPRSGPGSYVLKMVAGAVVANMIVQLDNDAQRRNQEKMKTGKRYGEPVPTPPATST